MKLTDLAATPRSLGSMCKMVAESVYSHPDVKVRERDQALSDADRNDFVSVLTKIAAAAGACFDGLPYPGAVPWDIPLGEPSKIWSYGDLSALLHMLNEIYIDTRKRQIILSRAVIDRLRRIADIPRGGCA